MKRTFSIILLFSTLALTTFFNRDKLSNEIHNSLLNMSRERVRTCFSNNIQPDFFVDRIDIGCGSEFYPKSFLKSKVLFEKCGITEVELKDFGTIHLDTGIIESNLSSPSSPINDRPQTYRLSKIKWKIFDYQFEYDY